MYGKGVKSRIITILDEYFWRCDAFLEDYKYPNSPQYKARMILCAKEALLVFYVLDLRRIISRTVTNDLIVQSLEYFLNQYLLQTEMADFIDYENSLENIFYPENQTTRSQLPSLNMSSIF